jgi:cellulose synthase/poly-beta-1,6-N-acetylglucosamine synthase-like glycosyltransferase
MLSELLVYVSGYFGIFLTVFYLLNFLENKKKLKDPKSSYLPSITIAIPAYNAETTVERTLKASLALNYPKEKLKILVVDDGSTDNTYRIAKKFEKNNENIKVYRVKHNGKGAALNFALKKCDTEIFATLDCDCEPEKNALLKMVGYLKNKKVYAVTSSIKISNKKGLIGSIMHVEYTIGIFFKKLFSLINCAYLIPGPLSLIRKDFLVRVNGFSENNLTEDLELGLRVKKHNGVVENSSNAYVYTKTPTRISNLFSQRLRWYKGTLDNLMKYKYMFFNQKYSIFGLFVLPAIFMSVILVLSIFLNTLFEVSNSIYRNLKILFATNFDIFGRLNLELDLFKLNLTPTFLIAFFATLNYLIFIILAHNVAMERKNPVKIALFILIYPLLYSLWWIRSIYYKITGKKIRWGKRLL